MKAYFSPLIEILRFDAPDIVTESGDPTSSDESWEDPDSG